MITVSDRAVEKLQEQLVQKCFEMGIGFRLLVATDKADKATFSIKIDKQRQGDEVIDLGGVKVLADPSSAAQIRDYWLDYQDEPSGGFSLKVTRNEERWAELV